MPTPTTQSSTGIPKMSVMTAKIIPMAVPSEIPRREHHVQRCKRLKEGGLERIDEMDGQREPCTNKMRPPRV